MPNTGKTANYFKAYDANDKLAGFIFSSDDLAPNVRGFGGKINIAIFADANGKLLDFHIIRSNETPAYLDMLTNWLPSLKGRAIFAAQPFANVDAVTGATVSSKAILESLARIRQCLCDSSARPNRHPKKQPLLLAGCRIHRVTYLLIAFLLTLFVIYFGGFWSRLFVLVFNVFIGGIFFNAQFSTEQVASLLSFAIPLAAPTGVFILTIGAPLLAILFGNIYCGYLCPFGALAGACRLHRPRPFQTRRLNRPDAKGQVRQVHRSVRNHRRIFPVSKSRHTLR